MAKREKVTVPAEVVREAADSSAMALADALGKAQAILALDEYSTPAVVIIARKAAQAHFASGFELGCALLLLKERAGHGNYQPALLQIGIEPRTAQLYAARARWLIERGQIGKPFSDLTGAKLDVLIKVPGELVADLVDEQGQVVGLSHDDMQRMTTAEFAAEIERRTCALMEARDAESRARGEATIWKTKYETATANLETLQGRIAHKAELARLPEFAATMRLEAVAQTEQMDLCLDTLDEVFRAQIVPNQEGTRSHYAHQAVGTYYHCLRGVLARLQGMVQALDAAYGEVVSGPFRQDYALNSGELALAKESYELVKRRHDAIEHNKLVKGRKSKGARGRHGEEVQVP